ncbi:unnamed protein product [Ostreobium quekettii]|uniref:Leucine-rich repeat protein n=1 Tax=Ostreobium quekettii TaxID=121088 RepID=A0A8S1IXD5_9CHLO|nr:unnamed protein product [Ostreobium quekettii]
MKEVAIFGEAITFGFSVLRRDTQFPDILLTMSVSNAGGLADIFCRPFRQDGSEDLRQGPFISDAVWRSNHTSGADYVFISRNHTEFNAQVRAANTQSGVQLFSDIWCAIWAMSDTPASVELELDVVHETRSLVDRETDAVEAIFGECCALGGCPAWRALSEQLFGGGDGTEAPLDLCHVPGSVCDAEGHAVRINMAGWGLDCEMPVAEFKKFPRLQKLDVSHNALRGDVEDILAGLTSLRNLNEFRATDNLIDGRINSVPVCRFARRNMTVLNLERNGLIGALPDCLFDDSTTLKELHLGGNSLSSTIPDVITLNSTLEVISLEDCRLEGKVPKSLANLTKLMSLDLRQNDLTGKLDDDLFGSNVLRIVSLQGNRLTGKVPSSIAQGDIMRVVALDGNRFSKLPDEWMDGEGARLSTNLRELRLSENKLKGGFPLVLAQLPELRVLDISDNSFGGPLPAEENLFVKTWWIQMANNSFSGPIPDEWESVGIVTRTALDTGRLPFVDLSNNNLTGDVPEFILDGTNFPPGTAVVLSGNDFTCPGNVSIPPHLQGLDCRK